MLGTVGALMILLAASCGPDAAVQHALRSAITNGTLDESDLGVLLPVFESTSFCTATLVAPTVVVTAAHCSQDSAPYPRVQVASREDAPLDVVDVVDTVRHPASGGAGFDSDVAVWTLARAPSSATPWPMLRSPMTSSWVGQTVRVVGFGTTGAGGDRGVKREGTATIRAVEGDRFELIPTPSQPCIGDSGGPVFATFDQGDGPVEFLVGIVSHGDRECAAFSRAMRVDRFAASFLDPYVDVATARGQPVGARCIVADNCAEGTCVQATDSARLRFCSRACGGEADCPQGMSCAEDEICRWAGATPGTIGTACDAPAACETWLCAARTDEPDNAVCARRCFPQDAEACASPLECLPSTDERADHACFKPVSGGCSASGRRPGLEGVLQVIGLLLACARGRGTWSRGRRLTVRNDASRP